ncbi:MAG: polysaccharide deacetylase family protein [bacterium]|nr:polysaccharide deacetylase family protein [bacterium]
MNFEYPLRFGWYYRLLPGLISRFETTSRKLWITFDDGPAYPGTPYALATLEKFQVKGTFFVQTDRSLGNRVLLRELLTNGHEIGLHGWHHRSQLFRKREDILRNWIDSKHRLEDVLGIAITRFRPPYADPPLAGWQALRREGFLPIYLTWMLGDFVATLPTEHVIEQLMPQLSPGQIVVLHDGGPAPQIFEKILPLLLTALRDHNWQTMIPATETLR